MMAKWNGSILLVTAVYLATSPARANGEIPEELKTPNYRITRLEGIGYDQRFGRQDPSNVIATGETYHVYTSKFTGNTPYTGVIGYATSSDGVHWKEQGDALLDTASVIQLFIVAGKLLLENASSDTAFDYFEIDIPANDRHTALGDVRGTATLLSRLVELAR
jgi:hypothetical protein